MSLTTPVSLFIFNRPDLTRVALEAIAQVKPQKLLIVADAARSREEARMCEQARAISLRVDWPCEVLTNFAETNLGCKERVAGGLDWVFSEVDEAIIIEDDCLAGPSFFTFAEQLLEYYRNDTRIMHINGCNFVSDKIRLEDSYYFSRYTFGGYGWASWRRAWKHFDKEMKSWPAFKDAGMLEKIFETQEEQEYWRKMLDQTYSGEIDTWDFQWFYAVWSQGGLSIVPRVNMVSNLGFRPDATHTKTAHERDWLANVPRGSIEAIRHPASIVRHREADQLVSRVYFGCGEHNEAPASTGIRYYLAALKHKLGVRA